MLPGTSPFLSTIGSGQGERRVALAVVLVSVVAFLAAAPFAKLPLPQVPAFLPIYQAALVVNDLITAILLLGQYGILRSRALLILACGYMFSASMAVSHALSFPGLFAAGGLLGAGSQTTAWLYFLWHGGFPIFVIGYALLEGEKREPTSAPWPMHWVTLLSALAVFALASGITLLAAIGERALPPIMIGDVDAPAKAAVAAVTWALGLIALAVVWRRQPRSVLDLWLMVVLCVWLFDTALAAVLNHGRYDLGWYAGRVYGLLASGFVLVLLLLENSMLYERLAHSNAGARRKASELQSLSSQLKTANDLLAVGNQQLMEASRLKSEFLANMSHELRTPLNAIIGFSEVLKDGLVGKLAADQREYITDIYTSGQHLLSLINDVLDLSKIEAGQMTLELEPTEMTDFFDRSLSIVKENATKRRLQLVLDVPSNLGVLLVDPRKTKQIVYNLLSNAVKFSAEGGQVMLRACRVGRDEVEGWSDNAATVLRKPLPPGDHAEFLQITVQDTGIGIAPEDSTRLFRMFSQLDFSLSKEVEGTGLGLALVERLALMHGGTVALASTPGKGSRFVAWLPWRTAGVLGEATPQPQRFIRIAADRPLALVIEDNERAGELIRLQLEPEGFEIIRACTAREALAFLATRQPTLVILDILLPDMDGWDLLARLKQPDSAVAHVPVVIVSIMADVQKGFSLGASAVLQKPVSREELLRALEDSGVTDARRRAKVLVVDDDPKAVDLLATYLGESGYSVFRAFSGMDGIEIARRERPDLIVVDLMMPEVSGFDVVEALKDRADTALIPIVIVTGKTLTAQDKAMLNHLAQVVLEKATFDRERFVNEVRRAVAGKEKVRP